MGNYDAAMALEILGAYAEQKNPSGSYASKNSAARELLAELAALDGRIDDITAAADPRFRGATVAVSLSIGGARVTYNASSGEFTVFADDIQIPVPIRFNRARGLFEGIEDDTSRVPLPGELATKRRDALAVIADALIEAVKKQE